MKHTGINLRIHDYRAMHYRIILMWWINNSYGHGSLKEILMCYKWFITCIAYASPGIIQNTLHDQLHKFAVPFDKEITCLVV